MPPGGLGAHMPPLIAEAVKALPDLRRRLVSSQQKLHARVADWNGEAWDDDWRDVRVISTPMRPRARHASIG